MPDEITETQMTIFLDNVYDMIREDFINPRESEKVLWKRNKISRFGSNIMQIKTSLHLLKVRQ